MRIFWLQCFLVVGFVCLYRSVVGKGFTIKIKLKEGVVLKITLRGKKENNLTETDINLRYTDNEQWAKLRGNMVGNSPEENIDNTTSLFDRIVVVNAFARSKANDEKYLFQGDILMSLDGFPQSDQARKKRAVIAFDYFRWSVDQGVPYKLHRSLDGASRRVILGAMREWEESLPCLKWRVKTESDTDFVHFFKGDGCYSKVGRTGGEQSLSIGRGCEVHGIVLHEMGHALGIFHEQSRPDRDNYVSIIKENILEGFETQFEKFGEDVINSYNIDYDYSSIMHYSANAFAKERGLVTIEPRPKRDVKFGQRDHLSEGDIKQARSMYGCNETEFIATQAPTTVPRPSTKLSTTQKTTISSTTQNPPTTQATFGPSTDISSGFPPSTEALSTEPITTQVRTDVPTIQVTTRPTTKGKQTTTAELEPSSDLPLTPEGPTNPITVEIQTDLVTPDQRTDGDVITTGNPLITSSEKQPEPVTTPEPEPTTQTPTKKPKVCVDLLSICYKWIRKGYCSPLSSNYCYMKYFCSKTCEIWRNSELSRGAACVDLLPGCESMAASGQCTNWENREYMANMCCESCRLENCIDEDRRCAVWASSGACTTFSYVQKHCKKSCDLCDF